MTPIIIPISIDPSGKYTELRYCLRSIAKHYMTHFSFEGDVFLVGPQCPEWYTGTFLPFEDAHADKDHNMIVKIAHVLAENSYIETFTKFSDDMILLGPYDTRREYPKYFCPMQESIDRLPVDTEGQVKWLEKFIRTKITLEEVYHIENPLNYDTHTPQPYDAWAFIEHMHGVDFTQGYVINSFFLNLYGGEKSKITSNPKNENRIISIKSPVIATGSEFQKALKDHKFLEVDNAAFAVGMLEMHMERMFPTKSRWEK